MRAPAQAAQQAGSDGGVPATVLCRCERVLRVLRCQECVGCCGLASWTLVLESRRSVFVWAGIGRVSLSADGPASTRRFHHFTAHTHHFLASHMLLSAALQPHTPVRIACCLRCGCPLLVLGGFSPVACAESCTVPCSSGHSAGRHLHTPCWSQHTSSLARGTHTSLGAQPRCCSCWWWWRR